MVLSGRFRPDSYSSTNKEGRMESAGSWVPTGQLSLVGMIGVTSGKIKLLAIILGPSEEEN